MGGKKVKERKLARVQLESIPTLKGRQDAMITNYKPIELEHVVWVGQSQGKIGCYDYKPSVRMGMWSGWVRVKGKQVAMVIVALSTEFRDVVYVTFRIEKPGLSPRTVITLQTPEKNWFNTFNQ